jgi:hypothetical protein
MADGAPASTYACLGWVLDELDAVNRCGLRPVLFGGWAKELHGAPTQRPHVDLDLLIVGRDIADLDALCGAGDRVPFTPKRHAHKRAYTRGGVLVELLLVVDTGSGPVTDFYGHYLRRWLSPLDVGMVVGDKRVAVASAANIAAYDDDHARIQDAMFAAYPWMRAQYRARFGTTFAPNRNPLPDGFAP